ncbi:MAG: hypothetical protein DRP74_04100 [Candidatus Omnitrophota bacterium]|nr:MAG: hypothetical protein DRP74_04100 [Candidatus Omnitrophota bacterium]
MARIKPFKGIIYNQEKIKDLSSVVCPPYDVISPIQQEEYYKSSPYNFLHVLLSKQIKGRDKYRQAAETFKEWQKNKILIQDEKPAIYFCRQEYRIRGERKIRVGFIAKLYLEDKQSKIFCHEHTRLEPKEDRYRLLKVTKANLSPIFTIFADKNRIVKSIYQQYIQKEEPFIEVIDRDKVLHQLWRIDSAEVIKKIQDNMQKIDIFIADGHHRYEVARAYRDEKKKRRKSRRLSENSDLNYLLSYFTNIESQGVTIMPVHRIVRLRNDQALIKMMARLTDYFTIERVKDRTQFFFLIEKAGRTEHILGLYYGGSYQLLRLKNIKILEKMIKDKSDASKSLDVTILNELILKNILGLNLEDKKHISFSPNAQEAMNEADNSDAPAVVFVLNPVRIQQLIDVSLNEERMPSKSTYFYPKVLSGLVVNKHEKI